MAAGIVPAGIREISAAQAEALAAVVHGMTDAGLAAPTRCAGWLAAHLLAHVQLGLAEQAASFAERAEPGQAADRDCVSYWRDWPPSAEPPGYADVRFYWATSSAYATADGLRRHFTDSARAAAGTSRSAPSGLFRFQGHVMAAEDILAMWTTELVIHQLDLSTDSPGPAPEALAIAVATLDGLLGGDERPPGWDDVTYVMKGTGRTPLDEAERSRLGERASHYPAFG
jgi:uncharacterized protein (TIGR03083 family)